MEYHTKIQSETRPKQIVVGNTGTWYHYNIVEKQGEREETHEPYIYYEYDGFWFPQQEFAGVGEGRLPNNSHGWDANLWSIFKEHQHSLTDTLYLNADRHIRAGDTTWETYRASLDTWNTAIDSKTMGDTSIEPIPEQPEK